MFGTHTGSQKEATDTTAGRIDMQRQGNKYGNLHKYVYISNHWSKIINKRKKRNGRHKK